MCIWEFPVLAALLLFEIFTIKYILKYLLVKEHKSDTCVKSMDCKSLELKHFERRNQVPQLNKNSIKTCALDCSGEHHKPGKISNLGQNSVKLFY